MNLVRSRVLRIDHDVQTLHIELLHRAPSSFFSSVFCSFLYVCSVFSIFFWSARPLPVAVTNDGIISREDVFGEELF